MSSAPETARRFPSPFEVPPPEGAEDWASMYPPYLLFSEDNREVEEGTFWFLDSLHRPEVEHGTRVVRTGDRLRVDGTSGVVTILD